MRGVAGIAAACVMAAAWVLCVDHAAASAAPDGQRFDRFLLFSGFDLWRSGGFGHGGLLWSPDGLAREGFTLKLLMAGGRYGYQSGTTEIRGHEALAAVMPGWRFQRGRLEVIAFAGPTVQSSRLVPDDPSNPMRGTRFGLRGGIDFWYQPSDAMMVAGAFQASTANANFWSRGAFGWRVLDRFWAGPEIEALGNRNYRQLRLGLHATGFKTGELEWSAGFGYARDSDDHSGAYGRLGLLTRR